MSFTKAAESANITKFDLFSNDGKNNCSLLGGAVELSYYESIFENSIKITTTIVDTGNSIAADDGTDSLVELIDGLKLGGGEKIELEFEDNFGTKLKLTDDKSLYLNQLRNTFEDTSSKVKTFMIDASSKEFFDNELASKRVVKRYDGKISESVTKILKQVLGTEKELDVDETENKYNFIGTTKKPFWTITWLAKKSVPQKVGKKGKSAGFLFFETYDGFKYKALDILFSQQWKKKYIYNNLPKLPVGYDGKILNPPMFSTNIHLQPKMMMGAYNTQHKQFNFLESEYQLKELGYVRQEEDEGIKPAGKEFHFVNEIFTNEPSRITYNMSDVGGLPSGVKLEEQLKRSKDTNLERQSITNQANMRYNQLGTIQVQIMIVGDFSLRAGDMIYCDFPELSSKPNQRESYKMSGIYMIADICHRINTQGTLTSLNLIRDSYGKPNK